MQALMREVDIHKKSLDDPILVHCSAGIGRSGAFLAIHMNLQNSYAPGANINIAETVLSLVK